MTSQVTRDEVLSMRRELFTEIPTKIRTRLADMDRLLGWPDEVDRLRERITTYVEYLESVGGVTSQVGANFRYLVKGEK